MRKLAKIALTAAMPVALFATTMAPANATDAAGAGLVQGAGGISPGLGVVPQPQDFSFGGSVTGPVVNGTTPSLSASCAASGHDIDGSVAEGLGTVSANCAGATLPIGVFVRIGGAVVAAFADTAGGAAAGLFAFTPDQVPVPPTTVTSYQLVGVGAAVHA